MHKYIKLGFIIVVTIFVLVGCNKEVEDTHHDTTSPEITITSNYYDEDYQALIIPVIDYKNGVNLKEQFNITDNGEDFDGSVNLSITKGPNIANSTNLETDFLYTLTLNARDTAGNSTKFQVATLVFDDFSPQFHSVPTDIVEVEYKENLADYDWLSLTGMTIIDNEDTDAITHEIMFIEEINSKGDKTVVDSLDKIDQQYDITLYAYDTNGSVGRVTFPIILINNNQS